MTMSYAQPLWLPVERQRHGALPAVAGVVLIGVLSGTGGYLDAEQIAQHIGTGTHLQAALDPQDAATHSGAAIELMSIRETLRLSVAETAQLFKVTRPTIYSWQGGKPPKHQHAERVRAIANALAPHHRLMKAQVGRVAQRAIEGRTTLLQALSAGTDPGQTIGQLAAILTREAMQRERLASRLRGSSSRGAADLDTLG